MSQALTLKARLFPLRGRSGQRPRGQRLSPGKSIQMVEDLLDHPRVVDADNDLHPPPTAPIALDVNPEYALQTLRPGHGGTALRCRLHRVRTAAPGAAAWSHRRAQTAVGCKYALETDEIRIRFRNERNQARD